MVLPIKKEGHWQQYSQLISQTDDNGKFHEFALTANLQTRTTLYAAYTALRYIIPRGENLAIPTKYHIITINYAPYSTLHLSLPKIQQICSNFRRKHYRESVSADQLIYVE